MSVLSAIERKEREDLRVGLGLSENEYELFEAERDGYVPTLWDVNLLLDNYIVGEEFNRLSVFSLLILAGLPTYISGDSGAGKTQLMDANSKTVLPGEFLMMEQSSDKAIFDPQKQYQIKKAKFVAFPELNKISKNFAIVEVLKTWGEGKDAKYERSILGRSTQKIDLPCRPFIFSRATESADTTPVPAELMTRVAEFTVDSSKGQTQTVMTRIAEDLESPWDIQQMNMVEQAKIRWYVSHLPEFDYYINPAASCLVEYVPAMFAASRRDFKKYLRNINGITRFHHNDRITMVKDGKVAIFSAPIDLFYNHLIFGNTLIRSSMRCNEIEKHIIKIVENLTQATKQDIQRELRECNINTTINNIETHLKSLTDIGYLMSEREGRELLFLITDFYKEFEIKPDFDKIVNYTKETMKKNPHYAEIADEYIERFCDPSKMMIVNPFNGNEINALDFQFEDINDVKVDVDKTRIPTRNKQVGLGDY
ncbi:hypothetical protein [Bacteroides sp.]|uniref:hypothetical protein n=1 Tax=Bacteroides sp. TaxID=29523 RepID=UPI002636F840|nr:hypothetical protein [Bacteroides sp.]MDD3040568.1 hypothetical protein [Bacteroides sp.]